MSETLPLVSIGLPIFNRPEGLKIALDCLINQTYDNIEIIIADNCSPNPEVEKIAREYLERDNRIRYYRHEENLGWGYNTNFVIEKAKGNYFMRATDDDWWDESFVEKIMHLMLKDKEIVLGFSNFIEVDVQGKKSRIHPDNHLPLLEAFTTSDKVMNIKNYVSQLERFGKSNLYFSIFKVDLLRSDFVRRTLEKEVLAGDLLINLYCLFRGKLVIVPDVLLKITFGNEKNYEMGESKSKILDFLFIRYDFHNFKSIKSKWQNYFKTQLSIVSSSSLKKNEKIKIKLAVTKRMFMFHSELIHANTEVRGLFIFRKLRNKYSLK